MPANNKNMRDETHHEVLTNKSSQEMINEIAQLDHFRGQLVKTNKRLL